MRTAKERNYFESEHLTKDLGRRSVHAGLITVGTQVSKTLLNMLTIMVLARLLTPADFGLIGMVTVFTGFVGSFKDLGLSTATIQRAAISHEQTSTLFWVNVFVSLTLALVVVAISPLVASFYSEPDLVSVTIVLGATIFAGGLSVQHTALLQRQMMFGALGAIQLSSQLVGFVVAIILALKGASYWALVAMTVSTVVWSGLCTVLVTRWVPGRARFDQEARAMIGFGGNLAAFNLVNYVTRNADNMLIGRFLGAADLGIYSRAYGLLLLPLRQITGPIGSVTVPALSRLQNQPEEFRRYYLRGVKTIALLSMPLVVVLGVAAEDVVLLLLGDQWSESVGIFRIFAVFAVFQPVIGTSGWIMVASGRSDRILRWGLLQAFIAVPVFAFGLRWGASGVATAATLMALVMMIPAMAYAMRGSPISLRDVASAVARPVSLTALLAIVILPVHLATGQLPMVGRLAALGGSAVGLLLIVLAVSPGTRAEIEPVLRALRRKS